MTKRDMLQATATEKSSNEETAELTNVLQYLAPWLEKTDGEEPIGSWETSLASKMMVKLLELWLTQESREKVEEILGYYDWHEDEIQECRGYPALQDHASDAHSRYAGADVRWAHEVYDSQIWEKVKGKRVL